MKKIYLLGLGLIFILGCSKDGLTVIDDNPDEGESLKACFELSATTLRVGEMLTISNCSEGATSYSFDFGNGTSSEFENPTVSFEEGGSYTITLTVSDGEETKTQSKSVTVMVIEASYLFPEIPSGFTGLPLEAGINPVTGNLYTLELYQDNVGGGGSKFFYRQFDEEFQYASNYIADKPYNSGSGFVNFYPSGKMNFVFSRTLGSLYGTQEVNYTSVWTLLNAISSATKHSYGQLPSGSDYLYFGTQADGGIYKTAVEKRNSTGDAFAVTLNAFGPADSMIGDMIPVDGGYVAYGAVFTKNLTLPYVSDYKPLLVFMDGDLNVTGHVIYENTSLTGAVSDCNGFNGSYQLAELSNGNLVMYANGELRVADAAGNTIRKEFYEGTSNIQALVSLGNSFVISSDEYLRKFNTEGEQTAQVKYNGNYLPELILKDNDLYFIAGFDQEDEIKIFYGACDSDLSIIDLTP
ncbi:PKD domain-containing protein [Muriicola jejuensis]|uniref:PKD domain-containing protein n=1 Tax=Muriicola jejuensis TaxID=504488 RepID=A0A6P0UL07_9FLAO|nr:PKD domain-containing protein [Muriicola jejuensis]NER11733.1 PKD domain-containing protein [Muriicola jejuensis]SMP25026.1 PKD domain-containing protein [Muriicola jejuensis]